MKRGKEFQSDHDIQAKRNEGDLWNDDGQRGKPRLAFRLNVWLTSVRANGESKERGQRIAKAHTHTHTHTHTDTDTHTHTHACAREWCCFELHASSSYYSIQQIPIIALLGFLDDSSAVYSTWYVS